METTLHGSEKVAVLPLCETIEEEKAEFSWVKKYRVGGTNNDVQFYESFTYDGVDYQLYDSVYVWCADESTPSLAKLVKMWETPSHKKRVKFVWYFYPCEIQNFLGDVKPLDKEVFLACGEGKGLFTIDSPEAIAGKAKVICTAKDKRNPRVTNEEMQTADYIFNRTFDVELCKLSENFPDKIAGLEVVHYFNRQTDQNLTADDVKEKSKKIVLRLKGVRHVVGNSVKDEPMIEEASLARQPSFGVDNNFDMPRKSFSKVQPEHGASICKREQEMTDMRQKKRRKVHFNSVVETFEPPKDWLSNEMRETFTERYPAREEQKRDSITFGKAFEVTRRPEEEKSKWFKPQPWGVKMQSAHENGALLTLENLDPSYTSSEVEDIVWSALKKRVDAKMIPRNAFSSPHSGKALVAFKSKDAAETAYFQLSKKCLVLSGGRPIVATRGYPIRFHEETKFHGHLTLSVRHHKSPAWRKALSTSHFSQPNQIEHEMALGWRLLQEQSTHCCNTLYEKQEKEMEELKSKLINDYDEQGLHQGKEIAELDTKPKAHQDDQGLNQDIQV